MNLGIIERLEKFIILATLVVQALSASETCATMRTKSEHKRMSEASMKGGDKNDKIDYKNWYRYWRGFNALYRQSSGT